MIESSKVARSHSLFRHTLVRVLVALLAFELLVGALAFWLLMLPVLRSHAQSVVQDVRAARLHGAPLPPGFLAAAQPVADGGPSSLPFNIVLEQELQTAFGQPVAVRLVHGAPGQYWFAAGGLPPRTWVFDQSAVVGTWPARALASWMLAALLTGLAISMWPANSVSRPLLRLRANLQ